MTAVALSWPSRMASVRTLVLRRAVAWPASGAVVLLVSALTIALRRRVTGPLGISRYDDGLYIRLAHQLLSHHWLGAYDQLTLVREPGYPLFIAGVTELGLAVKDAEQLVSLAGALLVGLCLLLTTRRLGWALAAFVFCAFDPLFLSAGGATYLRDPLFASVSVVVVASLFLTGYLLTFRRSVVGAALAAVLGGLSTAAYLLLREEGLAVLPVAAFALAAAPAARLVRRRAWRGADRGPRALSACLRAAPAVLVLGLTVALPLAWVTRENENHYGAALTSEWAQGSFLDAYGQWQRVDTGPVAYRIPITAAMRRAVYPVSPTARLLAPVLEDPSNGWRSFGCTTPPACDYAGGWMPWAMRGAAVTVGAYRSAPVAQAFFARIADDIRRACGDGRLTCRPALPPALQPVEQMTAGHFLDSFESLAGTVLTSRDMYVQQTTTPAMSAAERQVFAAVVPQVPATAAGAQQQEAGFTAHLWVFRALGMLYTAVVPLATALGVVLLGCVVGTRRGRRKAGPLTVLAGALLLGIVSRLALVAVVEAADYDASVRYVYPAHTLLLAFCAAAIAEGLRVLDLRRLGELVRPDGDQRPGPEAGAPERTGRWAIPLADQQTGTLRVRPGPAVRFRG